MECDYLLESRFHREPAPPDFTPYSEERIGPEFLETHETYINIYCTLLLTASSDLPGATDADLGACLDQAIRNRKAKKSGLYYDGRPDNRIAAQIMEKFEDLIVKLRRDLEAGPGEFTDRDELRVLMLVDVMRRSWDNGRRYGRQFMHNLTAIVATALGNEPMDGPEPEPLVKL